MMDKLTAERRSANMRRIKSKGMKPELVVRKAVFALGYRYRLHRSDLPGNPDLVLPGRRKIIFVHGCFWHGHENPACADGRRRPKSNLDYWLPKLARNKERDQASCDALSAAGWRVLTLWECDLQDREALNIRLRQFLESGGLEK
jgi:DNA mismatch endonuclease (patch repair protein)